MKSKFLTEGLDYEDMEGQVEPTLSIDEYEAKMGKNSDIVTLAFTVNSELAGQDLEDWFERGYDFVLDSKISDGEIEPGKYLVFVEMKRRSNVPDRIIELLTDLKTLTKLKLTDYTISYDDETYDADADILKKVLILNPNVYVEKVEKKSDEELSEMLNVAGVDRKLHEKKEDEYIMRIKSMAGL